MSRRPTSSAAAEVCLRFSPCAGLLGAFSVFMICAIIPLASDIVIHRNSMSRMRLVLDAVLIVLSVAAAATGTVWVFLPKHG